MNIWIFNQYAHPPDLPGGTWHYSDFPLWREIVEGAGCGLLVDPLNPEEIANAILWLLERPAEAQAMGKRGREAVRMRYNWSIEAQKLLQMYRELMQ